eukprot:TRINITY_DN48187_c0_g1_i1.p1 TRINITY_DN48187_c0_g1~~TRINITY_DN48187_c0_g1_i1.p1  ORF type:complete len:912 (-),score=116.85 TRINITY_DN48187_c0_g1_i1:137-2872(-)
MSACFSCWDFTASLPTGSYYFNRLPWKSPLGDDHGERLTEIIDFLGTIPIFKVQLPRGELPRIAAAMRYVCYREGLKVVKQGVRGRAFFVIFSGSAACVVDGEETVVMSRGDYWGGRALTGQEQHNEFSVVVRPGAPLEVLKLSGADFDRLGLGFYLRFPKRLAIYEGQYKDDRMGRVHTDGCDLDFSAARSKVSPDDQAFICKSLRENTPNLKAMVDLDEQTLQKLASHATRIQLQEGDYLLTAGSRAKEFYIIGDGQLEVLVSHTLHGGRPREAESVMASSEIASQFLGKEQFILHHCVGKQHEADPLSKRHTDKLLQTEVVNRSLCHRHTHTGSFSSLQDIANSGKDMDEEVETPLGSTDAESADAKTERGHSLLGAGKTWGEMSILYNARQVADVRAYTAATVYGIKREHFQSTLRRDCHPKLVAYRKLLDKVCLLEPLLMSQRRELARNVSGVKMFNPGETIIPHGESPSGAQWFVIQAGSCHVMIAEDDHPLAFLDVAMTFGERYIFRNEPADVSVRAGPSGASCLQIDSEVLLLLQLQEACELALSTGPREYFAERHSLCSRRSSLMQAELDLVAASELIAVAKLGRGAFGAVILASDPSSGREYAVKRMAIQHVIQADVVCQVRSERDILGIVRSPFIVQFFGSSRIHNELYLILEACTGGNLRDLLVEHSEVLFNDHPRGSSAMFYVACVASAFEYLHKRHIAYRDLKLENILLDSKGYAKLCDMGFARFVLTKTQTLLGTPDYMAPEIICAPHHHDKNVDWWALGVLVYELLVGQAPWEYFNDPGCSNPMWQILAVRECQKKGFLEAPLRELPQASQDFVRQLLTCNVRRRLGYQGGADVRKHTWFVSAQFDFNALAAQQLEPPWHAGRLDMEELPRQPVLQLSTDNHGVAFEIPKCLEDY